VVIDDGNCQTTGSILVVSAPSTPPAPTAGVSAIYCEGDAVSDLTAAASMGGTLTWYDDAGLTNIVGTGVTFSPNINAGNYTYYVTEVASGCEGSSSQVTVDINAVPTATVTGGGTICFGEPIPDVVITLTGSSPWSITYTDGVTPVTVSPGTSPYTLVNSVDGTYEVTALSDVTGCVGTFSGAVNVITNPDLTGAVTGGGTICFGDPIPGVTITLTGTPPWDLTYTDGVTPVTINTASSPYVISGGGDGTYSIASLTDASGCPSTISGSATILTNPLPVAIVSGGGTICANDPIPDITITLTGNGPWDLTYADGVTPVNVTGILGSPYVISGAADGTYTVTAVNDANCVGTYSGSVDILTNPLPTATVSGGGTICSGDPIPDVTIVLTGNAPWDITYTDGVTPTNITGILTSPYTISGGGDGTYTVAVVSDANCTGTSSGSAVITTNPTPVAPAAGTDATYCFGDPMVDLFAAVGGGTLTWYDDAGLTNVIGTGTSLTPSGAIGTVNYYVTETLTGCEGPATMITITVYDNPSIDIEANTDVSNCGATDGTITITVSGGTGAYQWQINGGGYVAGASPYTFTGLGVNTYVIDVFDGNCYDQSTTITVSNPAVPSAPVAGADATYCEGDLMVDMTATTGSGGTLTWYDDGALTNVVGTGTAMTPIAQNGATVYYVTETVAGCESPSTQVTITINALPLPPVAGTSVVYCDGDPISDLTATAGSGGTLNWYDDAGLTNNVGTGAVLTPNSAVGNYTYYVTETVAGCEGPATAITIDINPTNTFNVSTTDPTTCGGVEGTLTIGGLNPSTSYNVTYDDDGTTIGPAAIMTDGAGDIIITGLDAGVYDNFIVELAGCTTPDAGPYVLADPLAPTFTVSTTDPLSCGAFDGTITISGLNPSTSYNVNYDDDGTTVGPTSMVSNGAGDIVITGVDAGIYDNITVELNNCSTTDPAGYGLSDPSAPVFTVSTVDPSSCGNVDGSLIISGLNPATSYDITYDDGTTVGPTAVVSDGAGDIVITGLDAGVYDALVVSLIGCTTNDAGPYVLSDPAAPTFTVSTVDPTTCGGVDGSITISGLTPTTSYNITYDDGTTVGPTAIVSDGAGEILLSGLNAGSYTNIIVELIGCSTMDVGPYVLSDPGAPTFTVAFSDPITCGGTDGTITISGLTPVTSYNITYDDDGTTVGPTGMVSDGAGDIIITGLDAGSYANIIAELLGCSTTDVGPYVLSGPGAVAAPNAGTDSTYCSGQTIVDMTVAGTGGTYIWYGDAALTNNVGTGTTMTPGGTVGTTTYYVTETVAGCESLADSVVITVVNPPSAPIAAMDTTYCPGETVVDVTATGSGGTINWYDDIGLTNNIGTGTSFTPSGLLGTEILYAIEVDANGCESLADSVTIVVSEGPTAAFNPTPGSGNIPLDVYFDNTSTGGLTYEWDFGDNNISTLIDPNNIYTNVGNYNAMLTVTDSDGCMDTITVVISVQGTSTLIIPNIFTPNGDGINDVFNLSGTNITDIKGTIMNRWGQVVYQFNTLEAGWTGRTVSGLEAGEGTYFYIIDAVGADGEAHNYQGPFELIR
jgi:gliding motility-associated-like protein